MINNIINLSLQDSCSLHWYILFLIIFQIIYFHWIIPIANTSLIHSTSLPTQLHVLSVSVSRSTTNNKIKTPNQIKNANKTKMRKQNTSILLKKQKQQPLDFVFYWPATPVHEAHPRLLCTSSVSFHSM